MEAVAAHWCSTYLAEELHTGSRKHKLAAVDTVAAESATHTGSRTKLAAGQRRGGGKVTPEQVREVVSITLDELIARKLISTEKYQFILQVVDKKLYAFFDNRGDNTNISYALRQVSDDPYIDVIYFQYRDRKTLERIAEYMNKDISTVKRNKKRLIIQIYNLLESLA